MHIKGIIWVGSATEDRRATASFFSERLGMEVTVDVPGFTRLSAENGDLLEVFGPDSREHDQLDTGPVAGFWVDDVVGAHAELAAADVNGLTDIFDRAAAERAVAQAITELQVLAADLPVVGIADF